MGHVTAQEVFDPFFFILMTLKLQPGPAHDKAQRRESQSETKG